MLYYPCRQEVIRITPQEHIKQARKALGLSQLALGQKLGYADSGAQVIVSNWESGRKPVPLDKLRALAKALNIPLDYLIP